MKWVIYRGAVMQAPTMPAPGVRSFLFQTNRGENYEVYVPLEVMSRRNKLFQAGHRLYLLGVVDNDNGVMSICEAWFDRGEKV